MIFELWGRLLEFLQKQPIWAKLEKVFALLAFYLAVIVAGYQFIQWRYNFSPPPSVYLQSYVFKTLLVGIVTVTMLGLVFTFRKAAPRQGGGTKWTRFVKLNVRRWGARGVIAGVVLLAAIGVERLILPRHVSHIRIRFLDTPTFDREAFIYLIFELNKIQRDWYFEVDPRPFNENALTEEVLKRCDGPDQKLCLAEVISGGMPLIAITSQPLGSDSFWQNRGNVSVLSTDGWDSLAPPSIYEFLAYGSIVQSIVIQLNQHCSLPAGAFKESPTSYGDLLQFVPGRRVMKAQIMAAQLSRSGEQKLMNCFGVEYMQTCSRVLNLDWLHDGKVQRNLERSFGVKL